MKNLLHILGCANCWGIPNDGVIIFAEYRGQNEAKTLLNLARPITFIHIPKSGGSSIRKGLQNALGPAVVPHYINEPYARDPKVISEECALQKIENYGLCVIFGHFNRARGFGVCQSIPWCTQFLTVLRDPFDQHVSLFKYRNRGKEVNEAMFAQFLRSSDMNYLDHFPQIMNFSNFSKNLSNDFIHLVFFDQLDKGFRKICSQLGVASSEGLPNLNVSEPSEIDFLRYRSEFERKFSLQVTVYKEAKRIWGQHD